MQRREFLTATGALALAGAPSRTDDDRPVSIAVRADRPRGDLKPIWRFFGADEPNYAYMKDGKKKLLADLGELRPRQVYFRTHNLLTSGDGTPARPPVTASAGRPSGPGTTAVAATGPLTRSSPSETLASPPGKGRTPPSGTSAPSSTRSRRARLSPARR